MRFQIISEKTKEKQEKVRQALAKVENHTLEIQELKDEAIRVDKRAREIRDTILVREKMRDDARKEAERFLNE